MDGKYGSTSLETEADSATGNQANQATTRIISNTYRSDKGLFSSRQPPRQNWHGQKENLTDEATRDKFYTKMEAKVANWSTSPSKLFQT